MQVLLHPIHYSDDGVGYDGLFRRHVETLVREIDKDMSDNSTYVEEVGHLVERLRFE